MSTQPTLWSSLKENLEIARTLRGMRLYFDPQSCVGIWECLEVSRDLENYVAILEKPDDCIACGACVLQCPEKAIELR